MIGSIYQSFTFPRINEGKIYQLYDHISEYLPTYYPSSKLILHLIKRTLNISPDLKQKAFMWM